MGFTDDSVLLVEEIDDEVQEFDTTIFTTIAKVLGLGGKSSMHACCDLYLLERLFSTTAFLTKLFKYIFFFKRYLHKKKKAYLLD